MRLGILYSDIQASFCNNFVTTIAGKQVSIINKVLIFEIGFSIVDYLN